MRKFFAGAIFFAAQARRAFRSRHWREQKSRPPTIKALLSVMNMPQVSQRTIAALRRADRSRFERAGDGVTSQRTNRQAM